jgi:hypothetical protein
MKAYCLDTSGISNPLEFMPEDIHPTLWRKIENIVCSGRLAVTKEILDELLHVKGGIGACLADNQSAMLMEVGEAGWDWSAYIGHNVRMQTDHRAVISEYNGNRKSTVGLNDLTIIALGRTLGVPVVSMESTQPGSAARMRIPQVCAAEGVIHLSFNDFLRREGISV